MKEYCVFVDVIMSGVYYVDAENEEQAKNVVRDMFEKNPCAAARKADSFVGFRIEDVEEVEQ